jgi:RimJ/RimL family protein N-acetyltransferase
VNQVDQSTLTPAVKALFDITDPTGLRLAGILDGILPGRVFVDRASDPSWGVAHDGNYGSIYLGGKLDSVILDRIIKTFREDSGVLLGMWPDDPRWTLTPQKTDYDGEVLDFYDRSDRIANGDENLEKLPEGCEIRYMGSNLIERSRNREQHIVGFGSLEETLDNRFGFCLMRENEILCEALVGPVIRGTREMGVETYEGYRRQGYAAITCAHLVRACEAAGWRTWWNCNKENQASATLARKLGYRIEKAYRLTAWNKEKE